MLKLRKLKIRKEKREIIKGFERINKGIGELKEL